MLALALGDWAPSTPSRRPGTTTPPRSASAARFLGYKPNGESRHRSDTGQGADTMVHLRLSRADWARVRPRPSRSAASKAAGPFSTVGHDEFQVRRREPEPVRAGRVVRHPQAEHSAQAFR